MTRAIILRHKAIVDAITEGFHQALLAFRNQKGQMDIDQSAHPLLHQKLAEAIAANNYYPGTPFTLATGYPATDFAATLLPEETLEKAASAGTSGILAENPDTPEEERDGLLDVAVFDANRRAYYGNQPMAGLAGLEAMVPPVRRNTVETQLSRLADMLLLDDPNAKATHCYAHYLAYLEYADSAWLERSSNEDYLMETKGINAKLVRNFQKNYRQISFETQVVPLMLAQTTFPDSDSDNAKKRHRDLIVADALRPDYFAEEKPYGVVIIKVKRSDEQRIAF